MPDDIREILCRKWALEILRFLNEQGIQNYSKIEAEYDTSSDVISERLQELVNAGLLTRDERTPKDVRYAITANGEELLELLGDVHRLLEE